MNEMRQIFPRRTRSNKVRTDAPAYKIVQKFGGLAAFCQACGLKQAGVHHWLTQGLVPAKWRDDGMSYARWIIECGKKAGIRITAADFIED